MPVVPHYRVTFSGTFGPSTAPVEEWSWTLKTAQLLDPQQDKVTALAGVARTAYQTHLAPLWSANTRLQRVRAATVDEFGRVKRNADGGYVQHDVDGEIPGTSTGTILYPLQTAMVVSLMTRRSGPEGKGRMFLPWPQRAIGADYRVLAADVDSVTLAMTNFLNAFRNAAAPGPFIPHVYSSKAVKSEVTGVRIGRVPDTLRSRRSRLVEAYVVRSLA